MKRKYDYYCESNDQTLEAEHSWSITLHNWGELSDLLGIDPGETPREAPITRLIGTPTLLRSQNRGDEYEDSQNSLSELHPIGCMCGCVPMNPGIQEFQQKLISMMDQTS